MKNRAIALWAHPRSLSTVFERIIIARGDFYVLHEPFCTLYDTGKVDLKDPDGHMITIHSFDKLAGKIMEWSTRCPLFLKETLEYKYDVLYRNDRLLRTFTHTFIIREPEKTINSHYAMDNELTVDKTGYINLLDLHGKLKETGLTLSDLIDADDLVQYPEDIVRNYCEKTGMNYHAESLSWGTEDIELWSRTAKWHSAVQESTGIKNSPPAYTVTVNNCSKLKEMYDVCLPLFETLKSLRPL